MAKEESKKHGHVGRIIAIVVLVLVVCIAIASCGGSGGSGTNSGSGASSSGAEQSEQVTYKAYKVDKLMKDLEENAARAQEKYQDKSVALTGKLSNIDASGDYIDLVPLKDQYTVIGVQCYTHGDDEILDKVKKLKTGKTYVVKGTITDVGEVLGYSLDIDSISSK